MADPLRLKIVEDDDGSYSWSVRSLVRNMRAQGYGCPDEATANACAYAVAHALNRDQRKVLEG